MAEPLVTGRPPPLVGLNSIAGAPKTASSNFTSMIGISVQIHAASRSPLSCSVFSQCTSRAAVVEAPFGLAARGLAGPLGWAAPGLAANGLIAPGLAARELIAPGIAAPFGLASPLAYDGLAYPGAAPYGGAGEGNVAVAGELPVAGTTTVAGQVPIMGAVSFAGPVSALSQCTSRAAVAEISPLAAPYGLAAPVLATPCGLAASELVAPWAGLGAAGLATPYGLAGRGLAYDALIGGAPAMEFSPTSGGGLPVTSGSAIAPVGISVASDNVYEGALKDESCVLVLSMEGGSSPCWCHGATTASADQFTAESKTSSSKSSGSEGTSRTVSTQRSQSGSRGIGSTRGIGSRATGHGGPAITTGMVDGTSTGRGHHSFHSDSTHERQFSNHFQSTLVHIVRRHGDTDGSDGGATGHRQTTTTGGAELHSGGTADEGIVSQASASQTHVFSQCTSPAAVVEAPFGLAARGLAGPLGWAAPGLAANGLIAPGLAARELIAPGIAAPFGLASPLAYDGLAYPGAAPYGGVGEGNVAVAGELPVAGTTTVAGQVPIMGAVSFGGPVAAAGSVSITGQCSCDGTTTASADQFTAETETISSKSSGSEGTSRTVSTQRSQSGSRGIGSTRGIGSRATGHGGPAITAGMVDGTSTGRGHHSFHSDSTHERQLSNHFQSTLVHIVRRHGEIPTGAMAEPLVTGRPPPLVGLNSIAGAPSQCTSPAAVVEAPFGLAARGLAGPLGWAAPGLAANGLIAPGLAARELIAPGIAAPFGLASPLAYDGLAYPGAAPYGGAGEGNVAVAGELPVTGTTAVAGQVPIMGAVSFGGPVAAAGSVSITGQYGATAASADQFTSETKTRSRKSSGIEGTSRTVSTQRSQSGSRGVGSTRGIGSRATGHGGPAITTGMVDGTSTGRGHHSFHSDSTHERQLSNHFQSTLVHIVRRHGDTDGSDGGATGHRQTTTTSGAELHGGGTTEDGFHVFSQCTSSAAVVEAPFGLAARGLAGPLGWAAPGLAANGLIAPGLAARELIAPGIAAPFGLASPLAYDGLAYPGAAPYGGAGEGNVAVAGELPVAGTTAVAGYEKPGAKPGAGT
ncbi:hypothetical protein SFRURICE_020990 [Spodoptera frugiperda]|nr:hypothetical protein SFRURICE_020990 [Spodoptera frugiperda]